MRLKTQKFEGNVKNISSLKCLSCNGFVIKNSRNSILQCSEVQQKLTSYKVHEPFSYLVLYFVILFVFKKI